MHLVSDLLKSYLCFFQESDGADVLIETERALIYKIKKILEKQLHEAQKQMQVVVIIIIHLFQECWKIFSSS